MKKLHKSKVLQQLMLLTIVAIMLVAPVLSLGIAPGKISMNFEPGIEKTFTGLVVNTERKNLTSKLSIDDPTNIVTLHSSQINFSPSEYEKPFKYTIKLPAQMNQERMTVKVIASEFMDHQMINTILSVESIIEIKDQSHISEPSLRETLVKIYATSDPILAQSHVLPVKEQFSQNKNLTLILLAITFVQVLMIVCILIYRTKREKIQKINNKYKKNKNIKNNKKVSENKDVKKY